jgi:hypothetical protein
MMLPLSMLGLVVLGAVIGAGVYHLIMNVSLTQKGKRK